MNEHPLLEIFMVALVFAVAISGCRAVWHRPPQAARPQRQHRRLLTADDCRQGVTVLSQQQIRAMFPAVEYPGLRGNIFFADRNYARPTVEHLRLFARDYRDFCRQCRLLPPPCGFDCDDFVALFRLMAVDYMRILIQTGAADGLAIGEVAYFSGGVNGHFINCAATQDKGLIFIDPQTLKQVKLTPLEKASVDYIRF